MVDHQDFATDRAHWPDILFQYQPEAHNLNHPKPKPWIHKGFVLLDVDHKVVSRYPELPLTLASNETGCFLEYLSRLNDHITWRDVRALMPRVREGADTSIRTGTLSRCASVFRQKQGLPGWRGRHGSQAIRTYLDLVYGPHVVRANTVKSFRELHRWEISGLELIGAGTSPEKARGDENDALKKEKIADAEGRKLTYSRLWHNFLRQREAVGAYGEDDAVCSYLKNLRKTPREIYSGQKRKRRNSEGDDDEQTEQNEDEGQRPQKRTARLRKTVTRGSTSSGAQSSAMKKSVVTSQDNNIDPRLLPAAAEFPQGLGLGLQPMVNLSYHHLASSWVTPAPYFQSPFLATHQYQQTYTGRNFAGGFNASDLYQGPTLPSYPYPVNQGLHSVLDFNEIEKEAGDNLWNMPSLSNTASGHHVTSARNGMGAIASNSSSAFGTGTTEEDDKFPALPGQMNYFLDPEL